MSKLKNIIVRSRRAADALQPTFLLAVRAYWGYQIGLAGWGKLGNIEAVTAFFTSLGLPAPGTMAYLIGGTELVSGVLLVFGLFGRAGAVMLVATMLGAYLTAHPAALAAAFSDPGTFTSSVPFPFLLAGLVVLFFGPGALSVDRWLLRPHQADRESVQAPEAAPLAAA